MSGRLICGQIPVEETGMSIDNVVRVIEAIAKLLAVLAWPCILVFVLIRFGPAIGRFVETLGEFSLKGAGFEASAKRIQAEAAAALAAAAVSRHEVGAVPDAAAEHARAAAEVVTQLVTPRAIRRAREIHCALG